MILENTPPKDTAEAMKPSTVLTQVCSNRKSSLYRFKMSLRSFLTLKKLYNFVLKKYLSQMVNILII